MLIPVLRRRRVPPVRIAAFIAFGTSLSVLCFAITRNWLLQERWPMGGVSVADIALSPLLSILLASVGFHMFTRWTLVPISHWSIVLIAVALLVTPVLSMATVQVLPALHGQTDLVHAVKMGYPTFWVTILLPAATELALRLQPLSHQPPGAERS
jgi:hypothetical protein